ncbi:MAG TPA: VOC family protein [Candidatus Acidoferrales bacterium]|nr:VOC family protein [Candidatus Acidoferrales bacterium]
MTAAFALIVDKEHTHMRPKNTICLWFDKDAPEAARFYAATFSDSEVIAVHKAPSDFPGGKKGDELAVEFTVLGIPCLGLNGGPAIKHSEAFPSRSRRTIRKRRTVIGTQSSAMAERKARAVGARTVGAFPGRLPRAR